MKSKKTIGLLVLVIGIWGAIGYQIYERLTKEEAPVQAGYNRRIVAPKDSSDRYPLQLNYTDPFLKKISNRKEVAVSKKVVTRKPQPVVQPTPHLIMVHWEEIEYLGSVYNTTRQAFVAIVRMKGIDYMPHQGDIIDNFKVMEIRKDSIEVAYGTQKKYIRKK